MHQIRSKVLLFCLLIMSSSCGYRPGVSDQPHTRSITIPFVQGDLAGAFTAELVKQIVADGTYRYSNSSADLLLTVCLNDLNNESIGYRYETNYVGQIGQRLVASEDRLSQSATFTLIDCRTKRPLLGPIPVCSKIDFDFEPETSQQNQVRFSLGQLDFREAAIEDAKVPLYRRLAKEIVDYITKTW